MEFDGGLISPQTIVSVELDPTIISRCKQIVTGILSMGRRHKWKTALMVSLCYACFKMFNFFTTLKMMFGGPTLANN